MQTDQEKEQLSLLRAFEAAKKTAKEEVWMRERMLTDARRKHREEIETLTKNIQNARRELNIITREIHDKKKYLIKLKAIPAARRRWVRKNPGKALDLVIDRASQ